MTAIAGSAIPIARGAGSYKWRMRYSLRNIEERGPGFVYSGSV